MNVRALVIVLVCMRLAAYCSAWSEEKIISYDTVVELGATTSISVSEKITVNAEGNEIRRGIYRSFPGGITPTIVSAKRNGSDENWAIIPNENHSMVRIGREDQELSHGVHTYEIEYEFPNALSTSAEGRELFWHAVGNGWSFPVESASILVLSADSEVIGNAVGWTGHAGDRGNYLEIRRRDNSIMFSTARRLEPNEGFTVQIGLVGLAPKSQPSIARNALAQEILDRYDYSTTNIGTIAHHADYAYLSWAAYGSDEADGYLREHGWRQIGATVSINTLTAGDLVYRTYHKGWEVVVAFRGTATGADWITNLTSPSFLPSEQAAIARGVAEQTATNYPDYRVSFVGHSLGGRLAMVASAKTKKRAVVFNSAPLSAAEWLSLKVPGANEELNAIGFRSPADILEPLNISADYYADFAVSNIVSGPRLDWNFSHDIGILARAMADVSSAFQQGWLSSYILDRTCASQTELTISCPFEELETCVGSGCFTSSQRARVKATLPALTQPKSGVEQFVVNKGEDLQVLSARAYSVPCAGDYGGEEYIPATQSYGAVMMRNVFRLSYFGEGTFRYKDGQVIKSGGLDWKFVPYDASSCSDVFETWALVRNGDGNTGWVFADAYDYKSSSFPGFYVSNFYGLSRHDSIPAEFPAPKAAPNSVRSRAADLVDRVINATPAEREAMIAVTENLLGNLETGPLAERLIDFGLTPETVSSIIETKLSSAFTESAKDLTVGVFWELLTELMADGFATIMMESSVAADLPSSLKSPMRALLYATMSELLGFAKTAIFDAGTVGPLAVVFPVLDRIEEAQEIYKASHAVAKSRTSFLLAVALGAEINAELNAKHGGDKSSQIIETWEAETLENMQNVFTEGDFLELREIFLLGFAGLKWQKLGYTEDSGEAEVRALLGLRTDPARLTNSGWNLLDGLIKAVSEHDPRSELIHGFLESTSLADLRPRVEATLGDWKDTPSPNVKLKRGESYQGISFTEDGNAFVYGQQLATPWNTDATEVHLYFSPNRAFTYLVMRDWDRGGYLAGVRSNFQPFKALDVFPQSWSNRDEERHCSTLHDGVAWSPDNALVAFNCLQIEGAAELGFFRIRDASSFLYRPHWGERTVDGGRPIDGGRWIVWRPDLRTLSVRLDDTLVVEFERYRCKNSNDEGHCWGGWEEAPYRKTERFDLPW